MHPFNYYNLIIFDCDGVLFDSNRLKIEAMGKALKEVGVDTHGIEECKTFFSENFGKSRFFHIDHFAESILKLDCSDVDNFKKTLLSSYSGQCKELYLTANNTPFSGELLNKSNAIKYVASGSDQKELRDVFHARRLDSYFTEVFGSPEKKAVHVANIINTHSTSSAVMIGDAISDLYAARENNIDFIFYQPFSSVESRMRDLCQEFGYRIIESFEEIIKEI